MVKKTIQVPLRPALLAVLLLAMGLCSASCRTTGAADEGLRRARFVLESTASNGFAAAAVMPISQVRIPLEAEAIISEFDYADIQAVDLELGKCLLFVLKPAARRDYYRITVANQGKRLVLLVDGRPWGVRKIERPVSDGRIYIFAEASDEQVEALAKELKESNIALQKKLSR